jgi:hypothetical protein
MEVKIHPFSTGYRYFGDDPFNGCKSVTQKKKLAHSNDKMVR